MALNIRSWIDEVLRRFRGRLRKDEIQLSTCPYCGNLKSNFELSTAKLVFHCWACNCHGTARGFFYDFNLDTSLLPKTQLGMRERTIEEEKPLILPVEAVPILSSPRSYLAKTYLNNRGINDAEIAEMGLLFATEGQYANRIIWPLHMDGKLAYFVARRFMKSAGKPYMYPEIRRRNLVCVYPGSAHRLKLVLVEGVFQIPHIRRMGYSVMPLLGTAVTPEQQRQLVRRNFLQYIFLLDHDAVMQSIKLSDEFLREGLDALWSDTGGPDTDELMEHELMTVLNSAQKPSVTVTLRAQMGML